MQRPRRPNRQRRAGGAAGGGGPSTPHNPNNPPNGPNTEDQHTSTRGRGRGRGRASPRGHSHFPPSSQSRPFHPRTNYSSNGPVPRHAQLPPGTPVSMILKEDQPTGRQVQGVVSERLTKGDHPRGVKVRLVDGRVGRVQRVVDGGADASSFAAAGGDGAGGGGEYGGREGSSSRGGRGRGRGGRGGFKHVLDIRSEDSYLYDEGSGSGPPDRGLGDYFAEVLERQLSLADGDAGSRRNDRGGGGGGDYDDDVDGGRSGDTVLATCPVCHVFEGDEMAVAFHVEREHFGGD